MLISAGVAFGVAVGVGPVCSGSGRRNRREGLTVSLAGSPVTKRDDKDTAGFGFETAAGVVLRIRVGVSAATSRDVSTAAVFARAVVGVDFGVEAGIGFETATGVAATAGIGVVTPGVAFAAAAGVAFEAEAGFALATTGVDFGVAAGLDLSVAEADASWAPLTA